MVNHILPRCIFPLLERSRLPRHAIQFFNDVWVVGIVFLEFGSIVTERLVRAGVHEQGLGRHVDWFFDIVESVVEICTREERMLPPCVDHDKGTLSFI